MKLRRSALQFTLRSLFVLTFLVALGLGWFMTELRRARTQTEAVSLVSRSGGDVGYRFALGEHGQRLASRLDDGFLAYAVDVDFTALTDAFGHGACRTVDADLSPLERLPYVETLDLRGAYHLTDAGFKHLEHLTRMRVLDLASTPINDGGLRHLGAMTHLQGLSLAMTRVSDFGLEHLSRLTDLKRLDLLELRVTDTGLRQLRHLTQLRRLSLVKTDVTDRGLEQLRALTQLEKLYVWGTQTTPAGVNRLRAALPGCSIDDTTITGHPIPFPLKD